MSADILELTRVFVVDEIAGTLPHAAQHPQVEQFNTAVKINLPYHSADRYYTYSMTLQTLCSKYTEHIHCIKSCDTLLGIFSSCALHAIDADS